jgi:uncharacterized protein
MASRRELIEAITAGDAEKARRVLTADPSLASARDDQGVSLLIMALYYRQREVAEAFLAQREELDLFEAAVVGRQERVTELLDADPSQLEAFSPDGFQLLHYAAFFGHEGLAEALLARSAPVDVAARNTTLVHPLHSAVASNSVGIARRLLDAGAAPNAGQQLGFTPLMGAASGAKLELVELLLGAGADPALVADNGKTAKSLAEEHGHHELAARL